MPNLTVLANIIFTPCKIDRTWMIKPLQKPTTQSLCANLGHQLIKHSIIDHVGAEAEIVRLLYSLRNHFRRHCALSGSEMVGQLIDVHGMAEPVCLI